MSFILKIVEGPNRGAEVALVEGVAVTLGKADSCDIILADETMPDKPMTIEASADGVMLDGEPLDPFNVRQSGATAFAIGPAGAPWSPLVWPKSGEDAGGAEPDAEEAAGDAEGGGKEPPAPAESPAPSGAEPPAGESAEKPERRPRRRGIGCLVALICLLLLAIVAWFLWKGLAKPSDPASPAGVSDPVAPPDSLLSLVMRYGLTETNRNGRAVLVGDFATRIERLSATAEIYTVKPGVELDLMDAESIKTAVADTLALVGENDLSIADVTNRVAVLSGKTESPQTLKTALEAVAAEVPKLRGFNVDDVKLNSPVAAAPARTTTLQRSGSSASARNQQRELPVCGILTTPYPCLVLRSGQRVLEGAPFGDGVILKIEADAVTITNQFGSIVWNP